MVFYAERHQYVLLADYIKGKSAHDVDAEGFGADGGNVFQASMLTFGNYLIDQQ